MRILCGTILAAAFAAVLSANTVRSSRAISLRRRLATTRLTCPMRAQSSATACGTYVSLYGNRVHMGYGGCSHGTGYVNLGTNMLDTTAATIEIWARHDGVQNWSRVFDYGADNAHYFTLCWTYGTNLNNDRAGMKNPGEIAVDGTMAPYEIGVDYHIAGTDR